MPHTKQDIRKISSARPELNRNEYLQLLRTAKTLGKERLYLLVKLFAATGITVQELPKVTVEAVKEGRIVCSHNHVKEIVRLPECLRKELLSFARRNGCSTGPIFRTRAGGPMNRTHITTAIRRLCVEAEIAEEKGNPRCLKRLYQNTRTGIENNVALLIDQAMERQLEQEQLEAGWEQEDEA